MTTTCLIDCVAPWENIFKSFWDYNQFCQRFCKSRFGAFFVKYFPSYLHKPLPGATRMFHFTSINYENAKIDYLVPLKPTKKNFFYYNTTFLSSPKLQSCSQYFGTV